MSSRDTSADSPKLPRLLTPDEPVEESWKPSRRQLVQGMIGLGLAIALVVWGLPHFAETTWEAVFQVLRSVGLQSGIWLFALMVGGLYLYTFVLTGSLPGLSHVRALMLNVCGSAVGNLLPGGGAAGVAATYGMCRSWGFSRRDISTSIIVTGVWNVLSRVVLPVIGIAAVLANANTLPDAVFRGGIAGAFVAVALMAAFISVLASERAARWIGRGIDRAIRPIYRRISKGREIHADELIVDLRHRIIKVVRRGWASMTLGIVGYFGMWFVLFWFCLHNVGVDLPLTQAFAAYAVGRLLTAVGVTPGGLGVTESGTAAVLVAWGVDGAQAAAGVVLFAIFTHLMEIPLGALGWLAWSVSPKTPPETVSASAAGESETVRDEADDAEAR